MPGGRPKKEPKYNYALVKDLAGIFCTQEEIANILEISVRKAQLDAEFMRNYKNGIENAKSSIRQAQFKAAVNGNTTMLVWLGKQYLNQREPQVEIIVPEEESNNDMDTYDES